MDVNQGIVASLEHLGVDHVFGGSGQVNASMLLALKRSEKIKTVIVRNEQAASFMACGYSMFSDKLGVCFATGGPGAFNLFSGLAVAYYDSLPVLAISGYTSKPDRGKGALNESTGLNRTPDSHAMFSATTKKSFILEDPAETCNVLEKAINIAFEGRPGPVHIHIPKNVATANVADFRRIRIDTKPVLPDEHELEVLAGVLEKGLSENRNLLLLIGYGAIRSHAETELLKFVDDYQIPFATTMDAKGVLPEDHRLSLGVFGTSGDPGALEYFNAAEIVLALGNSFAENATFGFRPDLYDGKTLLHVNIDENELNKVYKTEYALKSDIKPFVERLSSRLNRIKLGIAEKQLKAAKYYHQETGYRGSRIHPGEMVRILSDNLPENAIVTGDAGAHMLWLSCYLRLTRNQRYQNPGSFGPMASHVNGAIGIKCANPDKVVVSGCGDGGYLMSGFELLTATQYQIPVVWVIFNNGEFNVIKKFLLNMYGEHAFMTFKNPDYVEFAHACGADGFRVDNIEQFGEAFRKAISLNRPVLIDVHVESEVYPPFAMGKV